MHETKTLVLVEAEMSRQVAKWGEQNHPSMTWPIVLDSNLPLAEADGEYFKLWCDKKAGNGQLSWLDILMEEVFESVDEARQGTLEKLRTELIQVAAVACSWVESIDRNNH